MPLMCDINQDHFARQLDRLLDADGLADLAHLQRLFRVPGLVEPDLQDNWQSELRRIRDIIAAMTVVERRNPNRLDIDQILRIAMVSGASPKEVSDFLRQFGDMREQMAAIL